MGGKTRKEGGWGVKREKRGMGDKTRKERDGGWIKHSDKNL
jgi:hypothetical protein